MSDIFKQFYDREGLQYGMYKERRDRILGLLGDITGKTVLDIGCGDGSFGMILKESGAGVHGVDISEHAIAEAAKCLDSAHAADIQAGPLPFPDSSFDRIVLAETIEHLLWPERAFAEAKRLLKPDGALVVTTPNFLVFSNRLKIFFGRFEYTDTGFLDRGHIHFFTHDSLRRFLDVNGWMVVEDKSIFHPKTPSLLGAFFPNLFTYQIILRLTPKNV